MTNTTSITPPFYVILNTFEAVRDFRQKISELSMGSEIDVEDIIRNIFDYLVYLDEWHPSIVSYVSAYIEMFVNNLHNDDHIHRLGWAIIDLAGKFVEEINHLGGWTEGGLFEYRFSHLTLCDVFLTYYNPL